MTKLLEWITVATVILVPWLAVVTNKFETNFTRDYFATIVVFPLLLVVVFGVVSVTIIAYRVYTFNDAVEASHELTKQIAQAKKELAGRGFKFETKADSSNSVS